MILAASWGYQEICESLVSRGCNLDSGDKNGSTALLLAARSGHEGVCALLISLGCNIDTQNNVGHSALITAAYCDQIPIMISLIEAGCDISLRDKKCKTAMDYLREKHSSKIDSVQVSIL